jgi:hypothetical protein
MAIGSLDDVAQDALRELADGERCPLWRTAPEQRRASSRTRRTAQWASRPR